MEEFRTYVFKKSKKKARKRFIYNVSIFGAIGAVIYMLVIGVMGIGIGIFTASSLIGALIAMKNYDDKYMGITAYGDRMEQFFITENHFRIGDTIIPFSELKDLVIYVDEYAGMPREIIGVHHGGNNEITFTHNDKKVSINYIIKNKSDFKKVENLVDLIENNKS